MKNTTGRKPARSAESRIGEIYGSLTVTAIVGRDSRGNAKCTAKCVCGTEKVYTLDSLVRNRTKSCGCFSSSKRRKVESHIGETINNMTLIEVIGKNKRGLAIGRFNCGHCGSEHKESLISSWKNNSLRSCGCKNQKKPTKAEDHIGIKYNHLTLIKVTGKNKKGEKIGLYHCSNCGNQKDRITISNVTRGCTKSCGCMKYQLDHEIGKQWGQLKLLAVSQRGNPHQGDHCSKGLFECQVCMNKREFSIQEIKSNRQNDCGCSKHHGYTKHKAFLVYQGMIHRCTNPLSKSYPQYAGRGISVCSRWLEPNGVGLQNFMDDVGNDRPSKKHSLHRMWKYNEENRLVEMMEYSPENCAWATSRQQNIEKRSPKLKKRVVEFEKLLDKGYSVEQMAAELKLSEQKVAFFLSIMGLLDNYKYQEGDDDV